MARVPYLTRESAPAAAQPLWDRLEAERKMPTAHIFRALANAPTQLDGFLTYANAMRGAQLSPRLRELAILTVGHVTGSVYEIAHHQSHATKAGVSAEQLGAIEVFETAPVFDEIERAVMRLAAESTRQVTVAQGTWDGAARHLDDKQMVELALTIAWYNSGVRIMALLDIELEDSYLPDRAASAQS
ncbi:MAG TPA: carboxymuconolactone decarboxylase family protein [Aldersonia sp.]